MSAVFVCGGGGSGVCGGGCFLTLFSDVILNEFFSEKKLFNSLSLQAIL